ncbi:hypothetical protein E2C01_028915 [Portunus trituberculatus]|uniref:Uncharacterized protein n=1 Tax=Portunus trituberculatus TaxID=210409 RepID=A0A5B7ELQ6_PORTR|nr:hypothetical protein [Portunus trituberculatus]
MVHMATCSDTFIDAQWRRFIKYGLCMVGMGCSVLVFSSWRSVDMFIDAQWRRFIKYGLCMVGMGCSVLVFSSWRSVAASHLVQGRFQCERWHILLNLACDVVAPWLNHLTDSHRMALASFTGTPPRQFQTSSLLLTLRDNTWDNPMSSGPRP